MREVNTELLGEQVMSRVGQVFGLDDECEAYGSFRPCGHPGVRPNIALAVDLALRRARY